MTASWGPALDAEVAYRHEQARGAYGRRPRLRWFRRSAPVSAPIAVTQPVVPRPVAIPRQRDVAAVNAGSPVAADRTIRRAA